MVPLDVSAVSPGASPAPSVAAPAASGLLPPSRSGSALLGAFGCGTARRHVDLCRLASAMCRRGAAVSS